MSINFNSSLIHSSLNPPTQLALDSSFPENLIRLVPQEWIDAGFCNPMGELQFIDNYKEELPDALLGQLLNKTILISGRQIPLHQYCNALLAKFNDSAVKIYLRGSYASYLLGVDRHLQILIKHFTEKFPAKERLMAEGLKKIKGQLIRTEEPDDVDFALVFTSPIEDIQAIKKKLIKVNSRLGQIPFQVAKDTTFETLFAVKPNEWCSLEDQIVIASLHGDAKCDFTVGRMTEAPYLFSMDNHAIVFKEGKWCLGAISGNPWQSFVDRSIGIVRFEERHGKDFRALLRAVVLLCRGAEWDTSPAFVSGYLETYLKLPAEKIASELGKKLDDPRVEPVSFVMNFLSLVADRKVRQSIWRELHGRFSDLDENYEEAAHQIAEQARAFPELYGAMPLLAIPAERALPKPSLDFLKRTLFMDKLPQPDENISGIYAEWRRSCHLLHTSETRTETLWGTISELYVKGRLAPSEEKQVSQMMQTASLVDKLVEHSDDPQLIKEWLAAHKKQSWTDKLSSLPRHKRNWELVRLLLNLVRNKADLIAAALQLKCIPLNDETQAMVRDNLLKYPYDQAAAFLNTIGSKVEAERKDWVIELWIAAVQNHQLSLPLLQGQTKKWLESSIRVEVKDRIALALFRNLGTAPFEMVPRALLTRLFADADPEEKEQIWLELLKGDPSQAVIFFTLHEGVLRPQLPTLFENALQLKIGSSFITNFKNEEILHDLFLKSLVRIPEEERLACARVLPQRCRLLLADDPNQLSGNDRQALQLDLLMETKSILLLWKWQKEMSVIPQKIASMVYRAFTDTKVIQITRDELITLIREGDYEQVAQLLPKLSEELKSLAIDQVRVNWENAFIIGDLRCIGRIADSNEFLRQMPFSIALQVKPEQLPELLTLIKSCKDQKLKSLLCQGYLAASEEQPPLELFQQVFMLLPHFSWQPHAALFLRAVTVYPVALLARFQSIESNALKNSSITGEQVFSYFLSLFRANQKLPFLEPEPLFAYLKDNPSCLEDASLLSALLNSCTAPEVTLHLLSKLIHTGDVSYFEDWLLQKFATLNKELGAAVIRLTGESPAHLQAALNATQKKPLLLGEWTEQVIEQYIAHCVAVNSPCAFATLQHLKIGDYKILSPLIETAEGFSRNAPALVQQFSRMAQLRPDQRQLLEKIVQQAAALQEFDLFEDYRELLERIQDTADIQPIRKALLHKQLMDESGKTHWLSCAETWGEKVRALAVLLRRPSDPALFATMTDQVARFISAPTSSISDEDFNLFLRLFHDLYAGSSEVNRQSLIQALHHLIENEESQFPQTLLLSIQYSRDEEQCAGYSEALIKEMVNHSSWDFLKPLILIAIERPQLFAAIHSQLTECIEQCKSIDPLIKEFFELRIELEDSDAKLQRWSTLAKSLHIDLTAPPYQALFAKHLRKIASDEDLHQDFFTKLRAYTIMTASTVPGLNLRDAMPKALERLVIRSFRDCAHEDNTELDRVLICLCQFFKSSFKDAFQMNPDQITHLGKTILFESITHPAFGKTDALLQLDFFLDLSISNPEKDMVHSLLGGIMPMNEWSTKLNTYYPSTINQKRKTRSECLKLIASRSSSHYEKWIKCLFLVLYAAQTAQLDFSLLKQAMPELIRIMGSYDAVQSTFIGLFDLREIKKSTYQKFFNDLKNSLPAEPPLLPQLTAQDLFQLCETLRSF